MPQVFGMMAFEEWVSPANRKRWLELSVETREQINNAWLEMNNMEETTRHINDNPDSLEIGTPSKGGAVKIYGDFSKLDDFRKKIDAAMEVRKYAAEKVGI